MLQNFAIIDDTSVMNFRKSCCKFCPKRSKICNINFWIENYPSPPPLEPKIQPFWQRHPSLRPGEGRVEREICSLAEHALQVAGGIFQKYFQIFVTSKYFNYFKYSRHAACIFQKQNLKGCLSQDKHGICHKWHLCKFLGLGKCFKS